jgi:hypothetical protein
MKFLQPAPLLNFVVRRLGETMPTADPRLYADERGVWREQTPGHPSGIEWNEVYRVSGHKLDGVTEVYTCVVLDFEYGEFIEFYEPWPGFNQVVAAITQRLPGIDLDWFQKVTQLGVADPPIDVWRRQS